jgi:hypothetical protein
VEKAAQGLAGQDLIIYPAKGQSQQQMEKDKFDCFSWAKQQSGFDPMQPPATAPAPEARRLARLSAESRAAGAGPERERPSGPSPALFSAG